MRKIVNLLFALIFLITLNDLHAQPVNTTFENSFSEPRIVAATSIVALTNYTIWTSEASQTSKVMYTSGMVSYVLLNEFINGKEQTTNNAIYVFTSTIVLNTCMFIIYNQLIIGDNQIKPTTASVSSNLGGIFSGMIVSYTLRF